MISPKEKLSLISKINATPNGLQNLLGNVNQGINPSELDQRVSPGIDMYPFWATNRLINKYESAEKAGVVGQAITFTVPDGEIWQVVAASVGYEVLGTLTDDTAISVVINSPEFSGLGCVIHHASYNNQGTAGDFLVAGGPFPDRLFLPSGWSVKGVIDVAAQATVRTMYLNCVYVKIRD